MKKKRKRKKAEMRKKEDEKYREKEKEMFRENERMTRKGIEIEKMALSIVLSDKAISVHGLRCRCKEDGDEEERER